MNTVTNDPIWCQDCWRWPHDGPCDPEQAAHVAAMPRVATVGMTRGLPVVLGLADGTSVLVPDFWLADLAQAVAVRMADTPTVDEALEALNVRPAVVLALDAWKRAGATMARTNPDADHDRATAVLADVWLAEQRLEDLLPEQLGAAFRDDGNFEEGWRYVTADGDAYHVEATAQGFVARVAED
jgi:hypothetical protein